MRTVRITCCAVALAALLAPAARAQDPQYKKIMYLTFSGPVSLPGMILPAGAYRFQLADPDSGRRVIRVSSQDGTKHYRMFLTMPNTKLESSDEPVVMFRKSPAGTAEAVRAWFYPGERTGYEFVYPRAQATQLAQASHESVLTSTDTASGSEADQLMAMSQAKVDRIDKSQIARSDTPVVNPSEAFSRAAAAKTGGSGSKGVGMSAVWIVETRTPAALSIPPQPPQQGRLVSRTPDAARDAGAGVWTGLLATLLITVAVICAVALRRFRTVT